MVMEGCGGGGGPEPESMHANTGVEMPGMRHAPGEGERVCGCYEFCFFWRGLLLILPWLVALARL